MNRLFAMSLLANLLLRSALAAAATPLPAPLIERVVNAPNPFDSRLGGLEGQTRISYYLREDADVRVELYDLFGLRVRSWRFSAGDAGGRNGDNSFLWDGTNEAGQKASKGGYLVQIRVESAHGGTTVLRKVGLIH
jgi:hypothetical protein